MDIAAIFAKFGFTVKTAHTCTGSGEAMRAFFAPGDEYRETACYVYIESGEVEIDVATSCEYFGEPDGDDFYDALRAAQADILVSVQ